MGLVQGVYRELIGELKREICHREVKCIDSIGFITYRCTSYCKTCTIWKRGQENIGELDRDGWLRVISRLSGYGVRSFEIFGGDALIRKDAVFDILKLCTEKQMETHFPTNANLCDRLTISNLIEAGLDVVYLSIDDVDAGHDKVRGVSGNFSRVRQALADFVDLRGCRKTPKISICTTISNMNYNRFPDVLEFLEKYPIDAVLPRPLGEFSRENVEASSIDGLLPEPYFSTSDGQSHLMTEQNLSEMKKMFRKIKASNGKLYIYWRGYYHTTDDSFLKGEYPTKDCRIATTVAIINPNGDVVPCPFFRSYVLGNLAEKEMVEIWGNEKHRKFIMAQQNGKLKICRNCNIHMYYPSFAETIRYYGLRTIERCGFTIF